MPQHDHRRIGQPKLRGGQHPAMARDQLAVVGNQARHGPAELRHASSDLRDLVRAMRLRVFCIGLELGQRPGLDRVRGKAQGHAGRFASIGWTPDTGNQPGLREGSSGHRTRPVPRVCFVVFFSGSRVDACAGWLPKKPALSLAILRASPARIRKWPRRNQEFSGLADWTPAGSLSGPRGPAARAVPRAPLPSISLF